MISRVDGEFIVDGQPVPFSCTVKEIGGGVFERQPLEVGHPIDYKGPFNYEQFRNEVERYYLSHFRHAATAGLRVPAARVHNPRREG